jgi:hypothetical protein
MQATSRRLVLCRPASKALLQALCGYLVQACDASLWDVDAAARSLLVPVYTSYVLPARPSLSSTPIHGVYAYMLTLCECLLRHYPRQVAQESFCGHGLVKMATDSCLGMLRCVCRGDEDSEELLAASRLLRLLQRVEEPRFVQLLGGILQQSARDLCSAPSSTAQQLEGYIDCVRRLLRLVYQPAAPFQAAVQRWAGQLEQELAGMERLAAEDKQQLAILCRDVWIALVE